MNLHDSMSRTTFLNTLQWLIPVLGRYSNDFNFALVKIAYGFDNELGDTYGAEDAAKQLYTLTSALQKTFRKADLIARNGTDFWIIFPYTPFSENIYEKIRSVINDGDYEELNIVDREIAIFTSPFGLDAENKKISSALDLLEHLKANQDKYAEHVFEISAKEFA